MDWFTAATGGSDTGRLAASVDWSATPLGPPSTWPGPLRLAVQLCFSSRFPMLVVWGPDLVKIYNDGYRPILGSEKHPRAMGAPAREIWPEIWDEIGPMFEHVMATGEPTWSEDQLLVIDRHGFLEEAYFTWSYGPIRDEDGTIGGILDVCTETTDRVVGDRRLRCLHELTAELSNVSDVLEACTRAVAELADHDEDVASADLYLDPGAGPVLMASSRRERVPMEVVRRVGATKVGEVVDGTFLAPFGTASVLAIGLNPRRPFDEGYRTFCELAAQTVGTAVATAYRRATEVGELRRIGDVLQQAMLPAAIETDDLAMRYLPAVGRLSVGGDWYDVVDLPDGQRALLVGDCVGHDLDAAARMGQLRSASRALLLDGLGPAATLTALDRFAASVEGAECTTVFCGIVDAEAGTFTYSSAGHPPPVRCGAAGASFLEGGLGVPLDAAGPSEREEAKVPLSPGDTLVLYTDGLIERRGESIADGLARLADVAAGFAMRPPGEVADELLRSLLDPHGRDDVAVLVHAVRPGGPPAASTP